MKYALATAAFLISLAHYGQNNWPWNPDFDGNNLIGVEDLVSILSVYNSDFLVEFPAPADSPYTIALTKADSTVVTYVDCLRHCASIGGHIITTQELALFEREISSATPWFTGGSSSSGGVVQYYDFYQQVYKYTDEGLSGGFSQDIRVYQVPYGNLAPGDTLWSNWKSTSAEAIFTSTYPRGLKRAECFCSGIIQNPNFEDQ
jgi:hypothetical protein